MRVRAQRAALALLPAGPQRKDQKLSRRDGASHLSLLVPRTRAQRKHTPPSRPVRCTGCAAPAGFSEGASCHIGRALVCTPLTNAHLVCPLMLKKKTITSPYHTETTAITF